jgi:hypothetical protein
VTGSEGNGRRFGTGLGPAAAGAASVSTGTGGFALTAGFSGLGRVS